MSYRVKLIRTVFKSGIMLASLLSMNAIASSDRAASFTLKWNAVEGASHYLLEEKQSDGSWQGVHEQQTSELSSTINKSSHGKYTYRVSGCIEDSGKTVHCGEEVAEYSAPLTVDTKSNDPEPHTFEFGTTNDANQVSFPSDGLGNITAVTPGEFRVDESGSATYQVPIELPEGPGGVKPTLGLSYSSSNTQAGIAGIGWSLSGLSSITRCAKSKFHDNLSGAYVKDVQLDETDAFCVDGQRLVEVGNGVYRTHQDSFTEYQLDGTKASVNGFIATTKSGETHYYGNVNGAYNSVQYVSSSLTNNQAVANTWLLSSITDVYAEASDPRLHSNRIRYYYASPNGGNSIDQEVLLKKIQYGSAEVTLSYTESLVPHYGYRFGAPYQRTQTLDNINVTNGGGAYRFYHLAYKYQTPYLLYVTKCRASGSACAKPVSFIWNQEAGEIDGVSDDQFTLGTPDKVGTPVVGDLDGDGYSDFIYHSGGGSWHVRYGGRNVTDRIIVAQQDTDYKPHAMVADFNGDGRSDVLLSSKTSGGEYNWYVLNQEGDVSESRECKTYFPQNNQDEAHKVEDDPIERCFDRIKVGELKLTGIPTLTGEQAKILPADVNGDGLIDLAYKYGHSEVKYRLSTLGSGGTMAFGNTQVALSATEVDSPLYLEEDLARNEPELEFDNIEWGDINGDGLSDIVATIEVIVESCHDEYRNDKKDKVCGAGGVGFETHYAINQGNGSFEPFYEMAIPEDNESWHRNEQLADVNGDGLVDFLYRLDKQWTVKLSNGFGFEAPIEILPGQTISRDNMLVVDVDADFKQELIISQKKGYQPALVRYQFDAKTETFVEEGYASIERKTSDTMKDSLLFGDNNGDGLMDLWRLRYSADQVSVDVFTHQNTHKKHRTITQFIDGMRNNTTVTYKPLTDESVYTGGVEAMFPIISARGPSYVVASASSPDGVGGRATVEYQYANMAFHGQGRGYLGFGKLTTIDKRHSDYDIVTDTFYHQGLNSAETVKKTLSWYQVIGMPIKTVRTMRSKNGSTHIVLSEARNSLQSSTSGGVYRAYISLSTEKSYFLNADEATGKTTYSQGQLKSTTTTRQSYDNDGNVLTSNVEVENAEGSKFATRTENIYSRAPSGCDMTGLTQLYNGGYPRFGRLTCSIVTKTNAQGEVSSRQSAFAYDSNGILYQEKVNAHSSSQAVITEYGFDDFGNKKYQITRGKQAQINASYGATPVYVGDVQRVSYMQYDATGRYLTSKSVLNGIPSNWDSVNTDLIHSSECYTVNTVTGLLLSKRVNTKSCSDASKYSSALTTEYSYNAFGQPTGERSPGKVVKAIYRTWLDEDYAFKVISRMSGAPAVSEFYDSQGRVAAKVTKRQSGEQSVIKTDYDRFGRAYRTSIAVSGDEDARVDASEWQVTEFDILDRVVTTSAPSFDGHTLRVDTRYNGFSIKETHTGSGSAITKTKLYNVNGELVSTTDNSSAVQNATASRITYDYDAYGKLQSTQDSAGNKVFIHYDTLGNKIKTIDPDKGTWEYRYNALGELKWQKDANGQVTWINYDSYGRVQQRITNAQDSEAQSRCFAYDEMGLGTKSAEWVMEGHSCSGLATLHQKSYMYDALLRPVSVLTESWIDGKHVAQSQNTYYDNLGRVYLSQLSNNYAVGYQYDSDGFKVAEYGLRYNSQTEQVEQSELSRVTGRNFRGQATDISYLGGQSQSYFYDKYTGMASGMSAQGISNALNVSASMLTTSYTYNAFGQLKQRKINGLYHQASTENFNYDGLNRLKHATLNYAGLTKNAYYCYDALGNMTTKGSTSSCHASQGHFTYGDAARSKGNAGVHALYKDTRSGKTFNYDNNGNMVNDGSRYLTYSGFDKVTHIRQSGNMEVAFRYGAGQSRYYRKDTYLNVQDQTGGKENSETLYYGAFERISKASGTIYQYTVGNMLISENLSTGELTHKLMVKDHLGSTLAISEVNEAKTSAKITQAFRYDPFGQQHVLEVSQFSVFTGYMRHGFTGHEMLNGLNIIHMNGRIYDPTLGRFLQADPHIQAPGNSQSYNRYSYVLNNPLSYTDPSGYFFSALKKVTKFVKKHWRTIAAIAISVYLPGAGGLLQGWGVTSTIAQGAITGFISGGVATGSLRGALVGAFSGAMFGHLHSMAPGAGKVIAHGITGGVSSVLNGGKFGHGFLSAGFTQAMGNVKGLFVNGASTIADRFSNAIKAAMIGGTASAISGGKFANGAVTGAFSRLLNDDAYDSRIKKQNRYDLKDGFEGFVDEYDYKGEARHEIHVYKNGKEVGIFQDGDWINKHGHSGVPEGFGKENARLLKGLDVHMIRRQGRIPKNAKLGKGMLRGYGKYLPVVGVAVTGAEMYNSSSPWQTFWEGVGVSSVGAGSTWEPEGINITYPEKN
ncbi:RHS repeat-associated core domain-containing protein [Pseudoalteromonas rubra]|uniref:Uncharacterized protein n=1 Tax=Pseudoalteromonas rubra TaxID=43658 RepID=A0A0U2ZA16_9GAMM|nr:RHS repeat-associated core domain-containing protein [Pseudoalteromonas rubra]ALU44689.1 hypothetical protein AT705_18120 [Pseudoalteromonas rubra]